MAPNGIREQIEKMTPSYIVAFFSAIEGILTIVLIINPEEHPNPAFLITSIISILIVIVLVGVLIYRNEIYGRNIILENRIIPTIITTGIYVALAILRIYGITIISAFLQFLITAWILILPAFIKDIPYASFWIFDGATGNKTLHTCNPNQLNNKEDPGKRPSLTDYYALVIFDKNGIFNAFRNPPYVNNQANKSIQRIHDNSPVWKIKYMLDPQNQDIIMAFLGELGGLNWTDQLKWCRHDKGGE